MTNLDDLVVNNRRFARTAAKDEVPRIPFVPNKQLYILTCIDPRVDPADVFGLVGGRDRGPQRGRSGHRRRHRRPVVDQLVGPTSRHHAGAR
jgi:hypothetical protein